MVSRRLTSMALRLASGAGSRTRPHLVDGLSHTGHPALQLCQCLKRHDFDRRTTLKKKKVGRREPQGAFGLTRNDIALRRSISRFSASHCTSSPRGSSVATIKQKKKTQTTPASSDSQDQPTFRGAVAARHASEPAFVAVDHHGLDPWHVERHGRLTAIVENSHGFRPPIRVLGADSRKHLRAHAGSFAAEIDDRGRRRSVRTSPDTRFPPHEAPRMT